MLIVLASQAGHSLAQLEYLGPELLHEVQEISRHPGRGRLRELAVHDEFACT